MTSTSAASHERSTAETVESVVAWAKETQQLVREAQRLWEESITEATPQLRARVTASGEGQTATRDLLAVRVPHPGSAQADSIIRSLQRPAARHHELAGLLEHAPTLVSEIDSALAQLGSTRSRRLIGRRAGQVEKQTAANHLARLKDWSRKTGFSTDLSATLFRMSPARGGASDEPLVSFIQAVEQLAPVLGAVTPARLPVLAAEDVKVLDEVGARGHELLAVRGSLEDEVTSLFIQIQDRMVLRQLGDLPVSVLREASRGEVRVGALERAGMLSVQQVLDREQMLHLVAGVSQQSARAALATARALAREARENLRLRVDWDAADDASTRLVVALHRILALDDRLEKQGERLATVVALVAPMRPALRHGDPLALLHRHSPRRGADMTRLLQHHARWARDIGLGDILGTTGSGSYDPAHTARAWEDFRRRVLVYQGLLGQIVGIEVDAESAQGHLPAEVVRAAERQTLDLSYLRTDLRSTLRGYQSFGARYALVQRRVLLGDEMGLGKTIQALTVMSHLASQGKNHFLVVAPPAVLVNWLKEVRKHSTLEAHRVHGAERERALRRWTNVGGVAVTSYGLLNTLPLGEVEPSLLVVDEAHMVKNPDAQRTQAVSSLARSSERVLFMSGTPLENKVEDFLNLVRQLQPEVADQIDPASMVLGAQKFRQAVAPVYLRRGSNDVLTELPELVESEEWLDLSRGELAAYLDALAAKDFHRMRHVAMTAEPGRSKKIERIRELVDEAVANHRKVLVYSFYRDVLERVREALGDKVVGVISGSMPPMDRQRLVDEFSTPAGAPVLVSQIEAGGVGLNIQAANVVILCEPQMKPSTENQAIKRAHRMGQPNTVQVHRLLTNDSIDERMLDILARKSALFDALVDQSEVAAASVEATDVTEVALRKEVLEREQQRFADDLRSRFGTRSGHPGPEVEVEAVEPHTPVRPHQLEPEEVALVVPRASGGARVVKQVQVDSCPSCGRPIDVLGHCGCS